MQVTINFENETIAQKILWILEHFKNDGVEIIKVDDLDSEIIDNFKEGLKELKLVREGRLDSTRAVEEFLDEL